MLFSRRQSKYKKSSEYRRISERYSDEDTALLIKLWKQRIIRIYITDTTPDFQAHLTDVLVDRLDSEIETRYSTEKYMMYKRFLAHVNSRKLFGELKVHDEVRETEEKIRDYTSLNNYSTQEGVYKYFLENYDI